MTTGSTGAQPTTLGADSARATRSTEGARPTEPGPRVPPPTSADDVLEAEPTIEGEDFSRVAFTQAAVAQMQRLIDRNGPLMFHQSGGCCDGSSPMCFAQGDFLTGDADVHLGDLVVAAEGDGADGEGAGATGGARGDGTNDGAGGDSFTVPVWMSRNQFEYWRHTHLTIDVVPGRGAGFSLEAPEGVRFLIRSRLLTDEEADALAAEELQTSAG